ncbi:MAG: hypothetical protein K6U74_00085 [Firmicutes bacterium]|nr:hypothetical protein [Bacillota bacterium]
MSTGITVDFSANVARFTSAIDRATNDLNKFQSNASRVSKNIGSAFASLGVGLSVAGVVAFGKSAIDAADNIGKAAEKSGIAVEKFSLLNYAAEQSELSTQQLTISLKFLNSAIVDNSKVLGSLGVATKDAAGNLRQTDDVLLDVAEAFKKLPDGALKSELAVKLFGKAGLDMINLLNQGKGGITAFTDEAKKMGLEISGDTAKAADEFNDNLGRLKGTITGLANEFLPALLQRIERFNEILGIGKQSGQTTVFDFYTERIQSTQKELNILTEQLANPIGTLKFLTPGFEEDATARVKELRIELAELIKLRVIATQNDKPAEKPVTPNLKKIQSALGGNGDKAAAEEERRKKALQKIQDDLVKSNDEYVKSLQDKAAVEGLSASQAELYEASTRQLSASQFGAARTAIEFTAKQKDQAEVTKKWTDAVAEANKEIDDDKAKKAEAYADAISRAFPERGEGLQYAEDVAAINEQLRLTNITGTEAAAAIEALGEKFGEVKEKSKTFADEFKETWADASRSFSDNFGRATADAILNSTKGIDVLRTSVKSFAREMIAAMVSIAARKAVDFVLSKTMLAGSTAANIAAGTATALAWAPAAAAVSLASFGGNSIPATAGIASTYSLTSSLALLGIAHDGLENVPKTGTYLLEGGERVVKKEDNKRLEKFLDDGQDGGNINITFNVRGVDAPRASEIVASQRGQIIGIIQGAYDNRLARGGPLR